MPARFALHRLVCVCLLLAGCADEIAPENSGPPESPPSHWKNINGSNVVGSDPQTDAALNAAIAKARSSAEAARARWAAAEDAERERWAIKWAAPTIEQTIEHVWVRPVNWSPFRVEGVLISKPIAELECGKHAGELVSFPIEELADWIYLLDESAQNAGREYDGGFTVEALEARFGKPDI